MKRIFSNLLYLFGILFIVAISLLKMSLLWLLLSLFCLILATLLLPTLALKNFLFSFGDILVKVGVGSLIFLFIFLLLVALEFLLGIFETKENVFYVLKIGSLIFIFTAPLGFYLKRKGSLAKPF